MASGSYLQVDVQCPFYRQDNGKSRIRCEGFFEGTSMEWIFCSKRDFCCQMASFCQGAYRNCEHYRALMQAKYADD